MESLQDKIILHSYCVNDTLSKGNCDEDGSQTRGKILAQILTQAVIAKTGEGVVNPRAWLEDNSMYSKNVLDKITNQNGGENSMESMFDEKAKRFLHLEDVLKRSAASYDEKVPK